MPLLPEDPAARRTAITQIAGFIVIPAVSILVLLVLLLLGVE